MINKYSKTKPAILIESLDENFISWRWDSASDKNYKQVTWFDFYNSILNYINDIEFQEFKCYEFNIESKNNSCLKQCENCKILKK
ncbi:hypothetical protein D3C87_1885490 [compost metagenome]